MKRMKRVLQGLPVVLFFQYAGAQELGLVSFSGGMHLSYFTFITDGNVHIRVSPEGSVTEWGIEVQSLRSNNYYAPQLQPYLGRVEYYGREADSLFRGKIKSVGSCHFTYYGAYEDSARMGKLKTIGRNSIDYYSSYEMKELRGRLKLLGSHQLSYYASYEDVAFRGKLRSVGGTVITYHSSFDDKLVKGKVKSIGPVSYQWYTSLDLYGGGGLKSGNYRQNIAGVVYVVQ
jgi:hypothetical protein